MNFHKNNLFALLFVCLAMTVVVSSCEEDDDHDHNDTEAPVINLLHPSNHSHYHQGDTVFFGGTVTDNDTIEYVEITLWDEADSVNLLLDTHAHPHAASYTIDTYLVITTTDTTDYHFLVKAEDHSGNKSNNRDTDGEAKHFHVNE